MRMIRFLVLFSFNLLILHVDVFPVFAKAPTTAKILFTSTRDGNREVYIMNPDGSEQVRLTDHPGNDLNAVWSPTGEQILFTSDRDGNRDLYLMAPDGSNIRRVFKKELKRPNTRRDGPTWSPDGKQIAYMYTNWDKDIDIIRITNLGEQEESFLANGLSPAWSPDGAEIAYSPLEDGKITRIDVRTGAQKRILPRKELGGQLMPSWSASGGKLTFAWNNNPLPPDLKPEDGLPEGWADKRTIYIVNRDGTGLRQLVEEGGPMAQYPELSPNGEEVLYTQEIKEQDQIFKVDVRSGVRTQLTHISWNTGGAWFDPSYALPVAPQPELLTTTWGKVKKR